MKRKKKHYNPTATFMFDGAKITRLFNFPKVKITTKELAEKLTEYVKHFDELLNLYFNNHEKGVCLFYSRDRGEDDAEMHEFSSVLEMLNNFGQQFNYIYKDKKWFCCREYTKTDMVLMTIDEAIETEDD